MAEKNFKNSELVLTTMAIHIIKVDLRLKHTRDFKYLNYSITHINFVVCIEGFVLNKLHFRSRAVTAVTTTESITTKSITMKFTTTESTKSESTSVKTMGF